MLTELIEDLDHTALPWDLVYLGRKRLESARENWVPGKISTCDLTYQVVRGEAEREECSGA